MPPSTTVFQKTKFPNGLTLVTEQDPAFRSLAIGFWVKAGTRHEQGREVGVSHFLEHMVFKGTTTRSALEIALTIDRVGGEFNAFTTKETTCFHVLVGNKDLDLACDVLKDVVLNSVFDAQEFERERKVILQEIAMVEDNPEELANDLFFETVHGKKGLGRSILGSVSGIKRVRRLDLMKYFRRNYVPREMVVAVSGNRSHSEVIAALKGLTRGSWGRKNRAAGLAPSEQAVFRPSKRWVAHPSEQVHLTWGVPGPTYRSKDRFALYLLNTHLGSGMSSVLFQEIREKRGLAYTVYSQISQFEETGLVTVHAATAPNKVAQCSRIVEECIARVAEEGITEERLAMLKENLRGTVLLASDSAEARMQSLAQNEIHLGWHSSLEEFCERVDAVTLSELNRVAKRVLSNPERAIQFFGPRPRSKLLKELGVKLIKR